MLDTSMSSPPSVCGEAGDSGSDRIGECDSEGCSQSALEVSIRTGTGMLDGKPKFFPRSMRRGAAREAGRENRIGDSF
jgi:hypothetical protein